MIPRIYINEPCPLEGYEDLSVRVLANSTAAEWQAWCQGSLGTPGCARCARLGTPPVARGRKATRPAALEGPRYCPSCTAARAAYAQSIVLFYGPALLGEDVSTPEAALALFDRDDALPSEIVIWLQLVPSTVRERRTEALFPNLKSS